ncbi:sulfate transport system permease protein CysW [Oxobacter pfennigii]|uniref:Sulfate transport system permease protein CysW n=1 Tax=Oxobacter pfennigii TaxID=36849 RepID=A0A0P8W573_9CLOT|nr:ABC transporter permease [Oxobacter pfennigii]KPU42742.1 sulfate transport system permease protein CysW [Oxobacter pfennigii]
MSDFIRDFFINYSDLYSVILMSMFVSLTSTFIASLAGLALGIPTALNEFKCKKAILRIANTLMSLPPVLMGLIVYMLLSRRGPLGSLSLLFTPTAMIIAQTLLVLPIIFSLTVSTISKAGREVEKTCISLGAGKFDTFLTIMKECRIQLLSIITSGFGRAVSEVGAVMMVGGNIKGFTRVMTTYIALETGKGNFNEAIFIGIVLLGISFMVNSILFKFREGE